MPYLSDMDWATSVGTASGRIRPLLASNYPAPQSAPALPIPTHGIGREEGGGGGFPSSGSCPPVSVSPLDMGIGQRSNRTTDLVAQVTPEVETKLVIEDIFGSNLWVWMGFGVQGGMRGGVTELLQHLVLHYWIRVKG